MIGLIVRLFLQQYLQKYNHLQPPDTADFSMVDETINGIKYFSKKYIHTLL